MSRLLVGAALAAWAGATLLLSCSPRIARPDLLDRLGPYSPGTTSSGRGVLSADSFREVVRPVAELVGRRASQALGVTEELSVRLHRVHSSADATAFRMRQLGLTLGAFAAAGGASAVLPVPAPVGLLLVLGAPVLAFLLAEHQLQQSSRRWQEQVFAELPVVSEQLGMLLASGRSLGTALQHVATRGSGACSADLRRVCGRVQHGLTEQEALREWAGVVRIPAVDRLVAVLALSDEADDLGPLVAEEARATRRDAHRVLLEQVERRSQQVWIPVTVATLVPGVLLLAVPFVHALRTFSAG